MLLLGQPPHSYHGNISVNPEGGDWSRDAQLPLKCQTITNIKYVPLCLHLTVEHAHHAPLEQLCD